MKRLLSLFLAPLLFISCHGYFGSSFNNPSQLTEHSIYEFDSVRMVMDAGDERAARKDLLAAIDVYKNRKDPGKSIQLFKKSIRQKPSGQAYFELGCALLDDSLYDQAIKALGIAEKLNYSPRANVLFKLASAYANLKGADGESSADNSFEALHYMVVSIQMGYEHPEQFLLPGLFPGLKHNSGFNEAYTNALSGNGSVTHPEAGLWKSFASEFQEIELPLIINREWIQQHKFENDIAYDYEKFVPEIRSVKFEREASTEYYYVGLVRKDTAYTALIYAGKDGEERGDGDYDPAFFILVTYDPAGKIIDKMQVAGQRYLIDLFKVFVLERNYTFEITDFRNTAKDNTGSKGSDSSTLRSVPMGRASYRIASNGKFEKTEAMAMR